MELVAKKYKEESGEDLTFDEFSMNDAEEAKKSLSDRKKTTVEIEREFVDLSRMEFEESISTMLAQIEMMWKHLDESEIDVSEISKSLAGGSTRMPVIREIAKKVFQREPLSTVNVDEVVAGVLHCTQHIRVMAPI